MATTYLGILLISCIQIALASQEIREHFPISGSCVDLKVSSRKCINDIEVRSSSINNTKPWMYVSTFRGNGDHSVSSNVPTIKSSTIYRSLFSLGLFATIFAENSIIEASNSNSDTHKIQMIVKEDNNPFVVGDDLITYFWGQARLPLSTEPNCVQYQPVNRKSPTTFCNIHEMNRCEALIEDVPHLAPFTFVSASERRLTHFAWLCPKGTVCAAWECANELDTDFPKAALISVCSLSTILMVAVIVFAVFRCREGGRQMTEHERRVAEGLDGEEDNDQSKKCVHAENTMYIINDGRY